MWGGPEATTCGKHYLAYENGRKFSRLQEKSDATPCRQAGFEISCISGTFRREFLSRRAGEPVGIGYAPFIGRRVFPCSLGRGAARRHGGRIRGCLARPSNRHGESGAAREHPGYQVTAASTSVARPLSSVSAGSRFAPALRRYARRSCWH